MVFKLTLSQKIQLYACTVLLLSFLIAGIAFVTAKFLYTQEMSSQTLYSIMLFALPFLVVLMIWVVRLKHSLSSSIQKRAKAMERLELFNEVFENMNEAVIITTPDFNIIETNPAFTHLTGYARDEVVEKNINTILDLKENEESYLMIRQALLSEGAWGGQLWEKKKNKQSYLQRLAINSVQNDKKELIHYLMVFSDITHHKQIKDDLHYLKHYDSLTNLPNRSLFNVQLESAVLRSKQKNHRFALALVGIDNFKMINDACGREVGDSLLQSVAKRLLRSLHQKDLIAHISGGEFTIIIEHTQNIEEYSQIIQKAMVALTSHFVIAEHELLLRASIGISIFPDDGIDANESYMHASIAMYHAKLTGRNSFQFYSPEMNDEVQARQKIEILLRGALSNSQFTLFYQPKVCAKTGKICGAEALLRWYHPALGWVPLNDFIPVAEESGLIVPLGSWVLQQACHQLKMWHNQSFKDLKISVNLSAQQFRTGDLVRDTAKILSQTGLNPNMLDLELTESVLMDNMERSALRLKVLKAMGITVSIDDFGTGYSSLSYLRRFPIDSLKIDKSFINTICSNVEEASIVRAIVAMAKELKIMTVAEGVETKEQALFLVEQGIDELQGFYFCEPLSADDFTALLNDNLIMSF